jgi:hypothetical protein
MKYTPKYFSERLPAWKRKKDPILSRIFYRPASFVTAALFSSAGVGPNAVSYFSAVVAIAACALFLPKCLVDSADKREGSSVVGFDPTAELK